MTIYADKMKAKNFEERVHEEDALYLAADLESFGGFSRDFPTLFSPKK